MTAKALGPVRSAMPHVVLTGGLILDGSGAEPHVGDVELREGRIWRLHRTPAQSHHDVPVLDISGFAIAPGFIDVHSHADNAPLLPLGDADKVQQGVTTEVVGNCGFSLAPVPEELAEGAPLHSDRIFPPLRPSWRSAHEFFSVIDSKGYVTNYVPLVGHGAIRAAVGGHSPGGGEDLIRGMRAALDEALDAGVFGLSTGLTYPPGVYADAAEIRALVERLPVGAVYATHMRNEGAHIAESLSESLAAVQDMRCRLHVSHLKLAGRRNWGRGGEVLQALSEAREEGVRVTQDAYPYVAGSTTLTACLPPWAHEGGDGALLGRLGDPIAARRMAEAVEDSTDRSWENHVASAGYGGVLISSTADHRFEGLTIEQVAQQLSCSNFEALRRILVHTELKATMVLFSMCEDDVDQILADPHTMVGSDGLPPGLGGKPHPRQYGTFPRVLGRYTRERRLFTLAEAVRKMTSLPAATFGLAGRGRIAEGAVADLVIFDPDTVADKGTFAEPHQSPTGIELVFIGGTLVVERGQWLGIRAGQRLALNQHQYPPN